jgi:membrane-associated PAP2 superfamily phosphatase
MGTNLGFQVLLVTLVPANVVVIVVAAATHSQFPWLCQEVTRFGGEASGQSWQTHQHPSMEGGPSNPIEGSPSAGISFFVIQSSRASIDDDNDENVRCRTTTGCVVSE